MNDNNNNKNTKEESMVDEVKKIEVDEVKEIKEVIKSKLELKIIELEEKEKLSRVEKSILNSLKKEFENKKIEEGNAGDLEEMKEELDELNDKEDKDEIDLKMIDEIKLEMAKINKSINEKNKVEQTPILMENGKYFPSMNRNLYEAVSCLKTGGFKNFCYVKDITEKVSSYVEISKSNGSFKELNKSNFIESVSMAYFSQFGKHLNLNEKSQKIDSETGEFEKYLANNGQEYYEKYDEGKTLTSCLEKVHGVVYTLQQNNLKSYVNEFNGRKFFNAKCDPVKIRILKKKVAKMSKIKKITKETAKAGGYTHVYAYYHNLINPKGSMNQGKIREGNDDDDLMSLIFNRKAYVIQTGKKSQTYPVFCSIPGLGKGIHNEEFWNKIYGDELSGLSSNDALSEQFNAQLRSKLYVAINELNVERKDWNKVSQRMKALTDPKMEVRAMGKDRFNEELLASFEMYSNSDTPFKLELKDRRAIMIWGGEFLPDFCARIGYTDTSVFVDKVREEMDFFIIDLLRLEVREQMAKIGIIFSDFRKDLMKRTNSIIDIVVEAIKEKNISEIATIFEDIDEEDLKEIIDHISHNFLTVKDCNIIGSELMSNYDVSLSIGGKDEKNKDARSNTHNKAFWDKKLGSENNLGNGNPVYKQNYTNTEGKRTSVDIRPLKGYQKSDLEKSFNVYVKHTYQNTFEGDDLMIDYNDDFSIENIQSKTSKIDDFLNNL
jgi:hypothetical protein